MRMLYPGLKTRREVRLRLARYFKTEDERHFTYAITKLAEYYEVPVPKIEWFLRFDNPTHAGLTCENGTIQLLDPSSWKKNRKYNSQREWITVALHEFGHYLLWADSKGFSREDKADLFAKNMMA
jgi:predicted SprT family Zn-dependent metalloprotease